MSPLVAQMWSRDGGKFANQRVVPTSQLADARPRVARRAARHESRSRVTRSGTVRLCTWPTALRPTRSGRRPRGSKTGIGA